MIIYFEDGSITNEAMYSITGEEIIKVDAANGYTANYNKLVAIEKERDFNTVIYTNSLVALSNRWCWDEENKMPHLYIRQVNNLAKMYVNGLFDIYNT